MGERAVFGLGNPQERYKNTRHNVGFMVIDRYLARLSRNRRISKQFSGPNAMIYRLEDLILVKPLTFMNRSGQCVKEVCQNFGIDLENCLIAYDDINIELGRLKAKLKGGSGGHKGMKSVIEVMDTDKIPRLKVGIGNRKDRGVDITYYVLDEFTDQERVALLPVLDKACLAIDCFGNSGILPVMNKFN